MFFMMDGNMQIDFNYHICCLKLVNLNQHLHNTTARYHNIPPLSATVT